jgi:hypothetical protein
MKQKFLASSCATSARESWRNKMGECGCSSNEIPLFRVPGPKGLVYILSVYPSCDDCDTPAGVTLDVYDKERAEACEMMRVEEYPVFNKDGTHREMGPAIPVIHRDKIREHFKKEIEIDHPELEYVAEELMDRNKLCEMVFATVNDWKEERERLREAGEES